MNVKNILKVADAIEGHTIPDLGFNMGNWFQEASGFTRDMSGHGCGTVACIAGWAARIATGRMPDAKGSWRFDGEHAERIAGDFLGMDFHEALKLFEPDAVEVSEWDFVRPAAAVSCLRHLAATGEVDWPRALRETAEADTAEVGK